MKERLIGLMMAAASVTVYAEEPPALRAYASLGYGHGGAALVSATAQNTGQEFELNAGDGLVLTVGADYRLTDRFSVRGSVGYQYDDIRGLNGDLRFARNPVELMGLYALNEQVRVGLGVRKVVSAEVTLTDAAASFAGAGKYDSSVGAVLEGQYLFNTPSSTGRSVVTGLNLRFISESFTHEDDGAGPYEKKDGSHIELGLMFYY